MKAISYRRMARPARVRVSFFDDPGASALLPLRSRRMWPVGIVFAVMCAIFAVPAIGQIRSMRSHQVGTVFDLMFLLFQGLWTLGWSVGVLILFLLAVSFLWYRESARISGSRLIHVPRLGPLKIFVEYDLTRIRNLRVASGGGPALGRIVFDYDGGEKELGNDMPRVQAEALVLAIQSAAAGTMVVEPDSQARVPTVTPAKTRSVARLPAAAPSWASPSSLALIGANLVPLAGVLILGWDLGQIMVLFWAENAVIGCYNLLKLAVVAKWGVLFLGPFFVGHYGGFMTGHFLFIYYLFVRGIAPTTPEAPVLSALAEVFVPLWPALLALFVSHGISFYSNFLGRQEYVGRRAQDQMSEPYKRIIILHVTIIFGGWAILLLRSPLPALVFLVVLKILADLRAHRKEHGAPLTAGR